MIYLVTSQKNLFDDENYKILSKEDALNKILSWEQVQFDTETSGRDPHICKMLCAQFGNKDENIQIVVDATTIDFYYFKPVFDTKLIIGHNLKFDCQFLYKYNIVPKHVWDTMIIEQLLHLGYSSANIKYSLKAVAERRLNINIDKTVRGEIIWRGLDSRVIQYAAGDVVYLENIMNLQLKDCKKANCIIGAKLENAFVPVIAYLEWCGIMLDVDKWNKLISKNQQTKKEAEEELNKWLINYFNEHTWKEKTKNPFIEIEHSFFEEFDGNTKILINWSSSSQVIQLLKLLGFNVSSEDKKTGKNKESAVEKLIKKQKGINDNFINIYYDKYQAATKLCSTYGQQYIDAINPITNRIHTTFKQLGASSGRMSCGNMKDCNIDLAKYKNLSPSSCRYVQLQNLPADEDVRSSFVSDKNNLIVSCDYSALESRLGADIYNENNMIKEFVEGSGDIHSLMAATFFDNIIPQNTPTEVIKHKYKEWRKKAKSPEFLIQFGGGTKGLMNQLGCTKKEAQSYIDKYYTKFKGIATFKEKGEQFVKTHGYVVICKLTGHKVYWENWNKWKQIESMPYQERILTLTKDELKEHNMEGSKWVRMALNQPTQGTGIIILKFAMIKFFKWIVENDLFNKVLLCDLVHDEAVVEFPKDLKKVVPNKLKEFMEYSSSYFCKKLPIPAEPEVGSYWIH